MERERRGCLITYRVRGHIYWQASATVGGVRRSKSSRDRAVCEAWLAALLAAHPTYETARPGAGRYRRRAEWCVAAYTDPRSAGYHIFLKRDWPAPRRVIARDIVTDVPIAWVADDNGGEGHNFVKANWIARAMRRDGTGIRYAPIKMNELKSK